MTDAFDRGRAFLRQPLVSRRAACGIVASLVAVPLPARLPAGFSSGAQRASYDIRYVLTDARLAASIQFGASFQRRGVERLEITKGLTALWRHALVPLWRASGSAVAGLTTQNTWAGIAEQARSEGRRSVLRVRHAVFADGSAATHEACGSPPDVAGALALAAWPRAWPEMVAEMIMRCPRADRLPTAGERVRVASAASAEPAAELVHG